MKKTWTREELVALDDRVRKRVEKNGLPSRPITDQERARFEELKKEKLRKNKFP